MRYVSKLAAGQILGDRYRIAGLIGSGGMSHVHLAEDLRLPGKWWAVKESVNSGETEYAYGDIEAEAELLIALNHPRLPRITDFYPPDEDGYSYLVMDYIEGVTLSRYMEIHPGPLMGEQMIRFAGQLLEVLEYLHGQQPPIVYRDLKPSNIMLKSQLELVLIDFGIARSYERSRQGDTVKLGTAGFAAPEQYDGKSQPVSDLYGLGALLLYMATGGQYCAWEPGMESRLHGRVPGGFIPILRRLLRHLPEERYPSAAAVMKAMTPVFASLQEHRPADYLLKKPLPSGTGRHGAVVIALMGVASGLGTTHTSLALSSRLSKYGSTAWVDGSRESGVYKNLSHMAGAPVISSTDAGFHAPYFEWNQVHYWSSSSGRMNSLPNGVYSFIVLDLGTGGEEGDWEAFRHSDVPLLIASGADWRLGETLNWVRRCGLQPQQQWKVLLPLAGSSAAALLQEALGTPSVYGLPLQHNPFQAKGKLGDLLEDMLKGNIAASRPRRHSTFFHKKSQ